MVNNGLQNALAVQVADGTSAPILPPSEKSLYQITWMLDSKSLLMIDVGGQIHQVFYPSGEMRQINVDAGYRRGVGLTSDGRFLATVKTEQAAHIWTMPSDDASRARQLTAGFEKEDGIRGINWMPDGRVVYDSYQNGEPSTWVIDANSGNSNLISKNGEIPTISSDGHFIVYQKSSAAALAAGDVGLWQMDISDGREKRLTNQRACFRFGQRLLDER